MGETINDSKRAHADHQLKRLEAVLWELGTLSMELSDFRTGIEPLEGKVVVEWLEGAKLEGAEYDIARIRVALQKAKRIHYDRQSTHSQARKNLNA